MPTYTPKPGEITRAWHVIDASDMVLGRLASQTAILLRGKHKPQFAPHVDTGDFGVIVNASQVVMTGNPEQITAARGLLDEARKGIYRILAGDTPTQD